MCVLVFVFVFMSVCAFMHHTGREYCVQWCMRAHMLKYNLFSSIRINVCVLLLLCVRWAWDNRNEISIYGYCWRDWSPCNESCRSAFGDRLCNWLRVLCCHVPWHCGTSVGDSFSRAIFVNASRQQLASPVESNDWHGSECVKRDVLSVDGSETRKIHWNDVRTTKIPN